MGKPVGRNPRELNGIVMRESEEIPQGMQALYDERSGQVLWVGLIGGAIPFGIACTAITLNPHDYDFALRSHLESSVREQTKRFRN